jgi:hypothetical protein
MLFRLLLINQLAMKNNPDNLRSKTNAGFSLVDIMVGMVISLLGTIIIFQVFSVSEGIKRTTTSGGDALQNGAVALSTLENSLKQAGYGFFLNANGATPATSLGAPPAAFAPVWIPLNAATNTSDSIAITYRQDGRQAVAGAPCSIVPLTPPNWDFGAFVPDLTVLTAVVIPALTVETFSIQVNNGVPQLCSSVNGVIADGIVLMKAEYGTDTVGNGVVTAWNQTIPANVLSVLAVRLVVVARSAQPEDKDANGKRATGNNCATTTVNLIPTSLATFPTVDISAGTGLAVGDSWKCYRYKTFENTVPIRW